MPYYSRIYEDSELLNRAKLVYVYLYDRMDSKCMTFPGIKRMASDLSVSRSTIKRALNDLIKAGYIRKETAYRENGSSTSNRYYVILQ